MKNHVIGSVLTLFLLVNTYLSLGQDTLYYQNGNIDIGNIVAIDSVKGKVAFQGNEAPVRVTLLTNLAAIGFDKVGPLDKDFFNENDQIVKRGQRTNPGTDFSSERMTKYGSWMVQVDALSPFFDAPSPFLNASNAYPYNSNIGIGAEHFITERFGLSAMSRVGIDKQSFSTDTIGDFYFFKVPFIPELLFEVNISSRIYPAYQRIFSPYLAPFISIGSLRYYHHKEFFRYEDEKAEPPDALYSILLEKKTEGYFQVGAALGFLLNFTKNINLSAQLNVVSTNATSRSGEQFVARGSPVFERRHSYYDKPRQINMNGQIFLAYRLDQQINKPTP